MSAKNGCGLWFFLFVLGVAAVALFALLGALGPAHTTTSEYSLSMCLGRDVVSRSSGELLDHSSCLKYGKVDNEYGFQDHFDHTVKDMVMMVEIPYRTTEFVFSRWFQYMLVDLDMQFKSDKFVNAIHDAQIPVFVFDVAIGYRNSLKGPWNMLANGTVIRHLKCPVQEPKGFRDCAMIPLFELGSVHHLRYLVNLRLRFVPLADHVHEYRGISQLGDMSIVEIHQNLHFTQIWLAMKSVLFLFTTTALVVFLYKTRHKARSLIDVTLIGLGCAVAWLGFPIEYLSLYVNCPWMIVYNDIRSGVVILAMAVYWIVFIGEHTEVSPNGRTFGRYWKQIAAITLSCTTLFVYEFCQRGIQVVYPFFSMWESPKTAMVANTFLWVAIGFAALYGLMLLFAVVHVWWSVARKEKVVETLSETAKAEYRKSMSRFKFLLFLLVVTSVLTIATYMPTELHEYGLEASPVTYSVYSGLLTGSYALWNVYTIIVLIISTLGAQDAAARSAEQLMTKTSQE
jgi:hypothetical protein